MSVFLCTYASGVFMERGDFVQRVWSSTGLFERVWLWNKIDLFRDYAMEVGDVDARTRKGDGWWRWKPEIALRSMLDPAMKEGDVLFCVDAGCVLNVVSRESYRSYFHSMVSSIRTSGAYGVLFCMMKHQQRRYVKKEAADFIVGPSAHGSLRIGQFMGGMWAMRKCAETVGLLREWREYCSHEVLIDESMAAKQPSFVGAHRHDQSIFSLVVLQSGLPFLIEPCFDTCRSVPDECPLRALRRKKPRAAELPQSADVAFDPCEK